MKAKILWAPSARADLQGIRHATLFASGKAVEMSRVAGGLVLHLPANIRDDVDTIVVLRP